MISAPEKIFLAANSTQPTGFCGIAWTTTDDILEPVEYLRKDAVLKWAKDMLTIFCEPAFKAMIDKIESM